MRDPIVRGRLLEAFAVGVPLEAAADFAGVSRTTLWTWRKTAEALPPYSDHPDREFLDALKRAEAELMVRLLAGIGEGREGWQALAWTLERRWPEHFGRISREKAVALVASQEKTRRGFTPDEPVTVYTDWTAVMHAVGEADEDRADEGTPEGTPGREGVARGVA